MRRTSNWHFFDEMAVAFRYVEYLGSSPIFRTDRTKMVYSKIVLKAGRLGRCTIHLKSHLRWAVISKEPSTRDAVLPQMLEVMKGLVLSHMWK